MSMEVRNEILSKANIPSTGFANRNWEDLPRSLQNIITKDEPQYFEGTSGSGFNGRERGITRPDESRSIHDVNQPKHVNRPYDDKVSEGFPVTIVGCIKRSVC